MISILLVDDHSLLRLGLIEAIETDDNMKVVSDVSSGEEAIEEYIRLEPDVVIMDLRMPEASGAETTETLLKKYPKARVLILSVYEGEEDIWRAVQAGAKGYLTKGADAPALLDAIQSIANDEPYFPARIAQKIKLREKRTHLTKREIDVLEHLVLGMSNKEISSALSISGTTVKLHLSNVFEKLGVADRSSSSERYPPLGRLGKRPDHPPNRGGKSPLFTFRRDR